MSSPEKSRARSRARQRDANEPAPEGEQTPQEQTPAADIERAAFQISFHQRQGAAPHEGWLTRAYREETATRAEWEGIAGEALLRWMRTVGQLPELPAEAPHQAEPPAAEELAPPPPTAAPAELPAELPAEPEPAAEPDAPADDLTAIEGIGPIIQGRMQAAGVRTYAQFARLAPDRIVEIVGIVGLPPERIDAWLEEARVLATGGEPTRRRAAPPSEPAAAPVASPATEPEAPAVATPPQGADSTYAVEILLGDDDEILAARIVGRAEPSGGLAEGRLARWFVEPAGGAPPAPAPPNGQLELTELEIEDVRASQLGGDISAEHLQARVAFELMGAAGMAAASAGATYVVGTLAHKLETGETSVVAARRGRLRAGEQHYAIEARLAPLTEGRQLMLAAVVVADHGLLGVIAGPTIQVIPP